MIGAPNRLPANQQGILQKEIFVSRASAHRPPMDFSADVDEAFKSRVKSTDSLNEYQIGEIKRQIKGQIMAEHTEVPPGRPRRWGVDLHTLSDQVRNEPLQLGESSSTPQIRIPTRSTARSGSCNRPIRPRGARRLSNDCRRIHSRNFPFRQTSLTIAEFYGSMSITRKKQPCRSSSKTVFELLYPESTFGVNFVRGITIIFCWLALMASIGLATASYLSFPVAAFASLAILIRGIVQRHSWERWRNRELIKQVSTRPSPAMAIRRLILSWCRRSGWR